MQSKSQIEAAKLAALLRARNPLIWVVTKEEQRVERYLFEAAASAGYEARTWDVAQGIAQIGQRGTGAYTDPVEAIDLIASQANNNGSNRYCWIMRDLNAWLKEPTGTVTVRKLRNLVRMLPSVPLKQAQAVIVLSTSADVPVDLAGHTTLINWSLPDRIEITDILEASLAALPMEMRGSASPNGNRDAAIDAAIGLSGEEAAACYASSLVQLRKIDPAVVAAEKKRIITRERVLEWHDPLPGGLDAVGGLEHLKTWLVSRSKAYSPEARAYGLPAPRGAMIVGVSGCGKSLLCKAIATNWKVPLLRLDLNALKSKWVGESEAQVRKAFQVIEALGRCVVWIDEIEKAMQGATSGSADGGVSADALGAFLNWMQERTGEAFVIATANNVAALPPELLRKGRFDELWFVDLPHRGERISILEAALRSHNRDAAALKLDLSRLASETDGFTGSEIAAIVPDAMFTAFADNAREIGTLDLVDAAKTVTPLSKTASEKIKALRDWSKGRARPASKRNADEDQPAPTMKLDIS